MSNPTARERAERIYARCTSHRDAGPYMSADEIAAEILTAERAAAREAVSRFVAWGRHQTPNWETERDMEMLLAMWLRAR